MTSSAGQQPQNPASASNTAPAAPSYASAAGASQKSGTTPVIASGTNPPPVAVGSSAAVPAQHGNSPSLSSLNGPPPVTPAVPTVAHGSSALNGAAPPVDHSRTSSVTISAAGPSNYGPNPGSKPGIQFGFSDSPTVAHSTPHTGASAPIPIPGSNPHRVPSPAHSPSPIPQPSASGGRPGNIPVDGGMKFGSFGGDERHPKPPMHPQQSTPLGSKASPHIRGDSMHSNHSDMGHGQGPARGGFSHQGRNRGFNQHQYPPNQGFSPNHGGHYQRPPPARNNGPPYNQSRAAAPAFHPTSPQPPPRASPALQQALPHSAGTPNMAAAMPMPGYQAQPHFSNPMAQMAPFPSQHGYQFPQHYQPPGSVTYPNYPPMHGMSYGNPPAQSSSPGFPQNAYPQGQYGPPAAAAAAPGGATTAPGANPNNPAAAATPMSRNSSQISERPNSSTGPATGTPSGTPQMHSVQHKPSNSFVKPGRKSAAITIKNADGITIDLEHLKGGPASPASNTQQSKTPPVDSSAATPPPPAASHGRTDSSSTNKTAEQRKKEFAEQVRRQAEGSKTKEGEQQQTPKKAEPAQETPIVVDGTDKKPVEPKTEPQPAPQPAEKVEDKPQEAPPAAPPAEKKPEEQPKQESSPPAPATDAAPQKDPSQMTEEELDAMFAEMEAADKRREEEQAAKTAAKKVEQEEAKKRDAEQRAANAAENDRKLREQEREMERLEEEKEKKREAEAKGISTGPAPSVTDELTSKIEDLKVSDKKEGDAADKMTDLSLNKDAGEAPKAGGEKRGKPSALNLNISTKPVEPPQPSAAMQSLKSARFLTVVDQNTYPEGIASPNPALNAAVSKKGKAFKYDSNFLLQFQKVFTEQPSLEFNQQVKALIGDTEGRSASGRAPAGAGRQNSRGGQPFGSGGMGSFGAPAPAKTLPSGTTSEQRFAMSNGQMARPNNVMPGFTRPGGAFPAGPNMSRPPSGMGGFSNSGRQGSRSTRGGSRRDGHRGKDEAQAAKTMPLTAGMDVKPITMTSSGWKPTSIGGAKPQAATGHMEPDMVQRKVKAALNKMTPEKFERIADQILEIAAQSKNETDGRTLRQVIQLTFEKATDEAHWASMYAKFCKRMLETMSPEIRDTTIRDKSGNVVSGGALFRKYLLNRCQEEFERGWQTHLPELKEGENEGEKKKPGETEMLSDEYYAAAAAKRRGLGLVQFIGELYKLGMLTERIMHECVRKLVDYEGMPDEAEIESLSKLLRTIGANLDNTERGKPMMDAYFARIRHMAELPELNSRLKFMLMDVIDLRRQGWMSKDTNRGPKTLEEIRADAEAAAAAKAAEASRTNQRGPGRPLMGRGDARSMGYNQPAQNQVGMDDLRRLKGAMAARTSSRDLHLGPATMLSSRSNSGRKLGPGGSLGRGGDDSGPASRTGTPPVRDNSNSLNSFAALANMGEIDHTNSPPSTSPAMSKVPPASGAGEDKKGGE